MIVTTTVVSPADVTVKPGVSGPDAAEMRRFKEANHAAMAEDRDGAPIFLARNGWELRYAQKQWPKVVFAATRERVAAGRDDV